MRSAAATVGPGVSGVKMSGTWFHMTAADLGREIGKGRINPVELTEAGPNSMAARLSQEAHT